MKWSPVLLKSFSLFFQTAGRVIRRKQFEKGYAKVKKIDTGEHRKNGIQLVAVAGLSPLVNGYGLQDESKARINTAVSLGKSLQESGQQVEYYFAGSRFGHNQLSLSQAQIGYALSLGVLTPLLIHGDDWNSLSNNGVKSTAHEAQVLAQAQLLNPDKFQDIYWVISPPQLPTAFMASVASIANGTSSIVTLPTFVLQEYEGPIAASSLSYVVITSSITRFMDHTWDSRPTNALNDYLKENEL